MQKSYQQKYYLQKESMIKYLEKYFQNSEEKLKPNPAFYSFAEALKLYYNYHSSWLSNF